MKKLASGGAGFFSFVLHAHLPYVLHHGTWPHGLEWLLEAAAETYLPLLRTVRRMRAEGLDLFLNISLSPVLLEQLSHPDFKAELPQYLQRKITSAQEDAAFFQQAEEQHLAALARHWEAFFTEALADLHALDGDLVSGFRAAEESGAVHLLTSAATHGYAPLLGTDEGVQAQFTTAVAAHKRHLHRHPQGVWLPECGYRPAGLWQFPVTPSGSDEIPAAQLRVGTEAALAAAGLRFTFVDTHLVEDGERRGPSEVPVATSAAKSIYRPYAVEESTVAVFARDPRTAFQVWSSQFGYPGDFHYLDFHKKRWPGGHRYWRVTGAGLGMEDKQPYFSESAQGRSRAHAEHFVSLLAETLRTHQSADRVPPMLCAPFDLELFGHWWHEGMMFVENVARVLARGDHGVQAATCAEYLDMYGTAGRIQMREGSWGAGGDNSVWLNGETTTLLARMYAAELAVRGASSSTAWSTEGDAGRIARQMCRELLLMQSSDWPTLITTGAARDYAERRFNGHADCFDVLLACWRQLASTGSITEQQGAVLAEAERLDGIFPEIDPAAWKPGI